MNANWWEHPLIEWLQGTSKSTKLLDNILYISLMVLSVVNLFVSMS